LLAFAVPCSGSERVGKLHLEIPTHQSQVPPNTVSVSLQFQSERAHYFYFFLLRLQSLEEALSGAIAIFSHITHAKSFV
jgi:hypothetical protein